MALIKLPSLDTDDVKYNVFLSTESKQSYITHNMHEHDT